MSTQGYKVQFIVDNENAAYSRSLAEGPFLRIRVFSADDKLPEVTERTYLESQISRDSLAGTARFHLVHEINEGEKLVHNIYNKFGVRFHEFDRTNTYPLVLGPPGMIYESVLNAIAKHTQDGIFRVSKNNKTNSTKESFVMEADKLKGLVRRELELSKIDSAPDNSVFMAGDGIHLTRDPEGKQYITKIKNPAVLHRSSRPLISSIAMTVGELSENFGLIQGHVTGVRGLSQENVHEFLELVSKKSALIDKGNMKEEKTKDKEIKRTKRKQKANIPAKFAFKTKFDPRSRVARNFSR